MAHEHHRGKIKDNALKALVTSPLFRTRTETSKKGKGSYNRKAKFKGKGYDKTVLRDIFVVAFSLAGHIRGLFIR